MGRYHNYPLHKSNLATFIIAGSFGASVLGGTWTVTRPMLMTLVPKEKAAQFFGFQGLTEKFSGVLGPIVFGFVVVKSGYRPAILVMLIFFIVALFFLRYVPKKSVNI